MKERPGSRSLGRIAIALCGCAVVGLLLVPSSVLAYLRHRYLWLGRFVDCLELFSSKGVNLSHVVAFAVLGLLAKLALPRSTLWIVVACTVAIGLGTEFAQIWIPGRTPRFWDIVNNTVGVLAGMAIGALLPERSGSGRS